jgi:hypothetical protein
MTDPAMMMRTSQNHDPMDYSTSLLIKQTEARAKELIAERQIISLKQQIENCEHREEEAILDGNKERAR